MLFRTAVCVAALASLSLTVGCTGIPAIYAYPKINYFPATDLNAGGAEVHGVSRQDHPRLGGTWPPP